MYGGALRRFLAASVTLMMLAGCAGMSTVTSPTSPGTAEKDQANAFLQVARYEEERGDMVAAAQQVKLALTLDPRNAEARQAHSRLQKELKARSNRHVAAGKRYHEKGKYRLARRELLLALRLWPDRPDADRIVETLRRMPAK